MNKTAVTVGSAVFGGAVSKGLTGMIEVSNPVKIVMSLVLCAGSGYLASQVSGNDTKASALQGAYMGAAVAQGLEAFKAIASTPAISDRLSPDTTFGKFAQKSLGLSGMANGLNGFVDNDGNYHDDNLAGYISGDGNLNAYDGELNASYDDFGNQLNAMDINFHELNGAFDEEELNAYDEELNAYYEELNAYEEIEIV